MGVRVAAAAGSGAERVEVGGRVWPGLCDAHIHLDQRVARRLAVDLAGAATRREAFGRIRRAAGRLPAEAWLVGSGWHNESWKDDASWPRAEEVEAATGGRPALLSPRTATPPC